MNSDQELVDYVQNPRYGYDSAYQSLCFGIVINKMPETDGVYEYKIRLNASSSSGSTVGTRQLRTDELAK